MLKIKNLVAFFLNRQKRVHQSAALYTTYTMKKIAFLKTFNCLCIKYFDKNGKNVKI